MQDNIASRFAALDAWYQQPLGQALATVVSEYLAEPLSTLFGYHAIQLGLPSQRLWLQHAPIPHQMVIDHSYTAQTIACVAPFTQLPLASASIDLAILPHTLSFVDDPLATLAEVDRVLVADGHLVLFGVNPFSLWGMRYLLSRPGTRIPWSGHCLPIYRLRRALTQIGYDIRSLETLFHRAPVENPRLLRKLQFMETMSELARIIPGSLVVIVAQKSTLSMTKIQPLWSYKNFVIGKRFIQPATKQAHHRRSAR